MMRFGLPVETVSDNPLPKIILGYVSVRGKESVFDSGATMLNTEAGAYHATTSDRAEVSRNLQSEGFTIISESPLGLSVCGPPEAFSNLTGGAVMAKERLIHAEAGYHLYRTHLDIVGDLQPETLGVGRVRSTLMKVDGVMLERPRIRHSVFPSPSPPSSPKYHLRVPDDVAAILNAITSHRSGALGAGILVAMPDTGFYRHPFFTVQHYDVTTPIAIVPGTDRSKDPIGHGTGEAANIFAVAPGCTLQPIRASDNQGQLVGSIAGFLKAKEISPRVITSSWGGDEGFPPSGPPNQMDLAFAAEIQDAIQRKILVIFSAGNGQFSVEPQVPGVLAAGGVFVDQNGNLRASDYASGYQSTWFNNPVIPTVCGLVGMQPRAQYLMLPVPPGSEIDQEEAKVTSDDPETDGTPGDDGWALFSGTSAAAPQVAGAAALLLGAKPAMLPEQVIEALSRTAVDVIVGRSFPQRFNEPATPGPDLATGAGLIDVGAALQYARDHF
jgi:subtilisin family serine protease